MRLVMVYHENGGNESFEVGGAGSGGQVMSTLKAFSDPNMSHNFMLIEFKYLAGNSRRCWTEDETAQCLAAGAHDAAVMLEGTYDDVLRAGGCEEGGESEQVHERDKSDYKGGARGQPTVCTYAYDGWNQTATLENCQTLRAVNSEGEGNDAVVKVCVIGDAVP